MSDIYTGGSNPGGQLFYVDGDFTTAAPSGPPSITTPFIGDTIVSSSDIILLASAPGPTSRRDYVNVPVGTGYNQQPLFANQSTILIEQEFIVAQAYYVPQVLNSPYDVSWSLGWQNTYANLEDSILVEEGPLEDIGAGLVKFKRTYSILPPTRSVPETFAYQFPGMTIPDYLGGGYRSNFSKLVASRVQEDFFLWDAVDTATQFSLFPFGPRLNQQTGMNPTGLIIPEQKYYISNDSSIDPVSLNMFLDPPVLSDPDPGYPGDGKLSGTTPTASQYTAYVGYGDTNDARGYYFTSNQQAAEIVAEPSCLEQWKGNIYRRRTRFVVAI
jgi:hypothetical protein